MGGAQPLAVTMNGGTVLCIECDPVRAQKRLATRYLDVLAETLDDGIALALDAKRKHKAVSIAVIGNAAEVLPELLRRGVEIDIVTDQTSAHDPLAYLPIGVRLEEWHDYAAAKPEEFTDRARASMATHVEAMVGFQDAGAEVFDYGNSIRGEAQLAGYERAFDFPGFVPAYIRPLFCEGKGPFRWAALSGDPADIHATDKAVRRLFPDNDSLQRWMRLAPERIAFQGLPARICWLGAGERDKAGLEFNAMVASGELSAPVVIGRDHLDAGSVASPYRETEAMADGSDAIADWPLLNALVSTASGASWVSIHHGGGVGIGRSIHAGQVTVADGTELAAQKVERVLTNDPAMGVLRHVDAGYPEAERGGRRSAMPGPMTPGRRLPMPIAPVPVPPMPGEERHEVRPAARRRQPVRLRLVRSGRRRPGPAPRRVLPARLRRRRNAIAAVVHRAGAAPRTGGGDRPQRQHLGLVGFTGGLQMAP